jgi:hypothetical protein
MTFYDLDRDIARAGPSTMRIQIQRLGRIKIRTGSLGTRDSKGNGIILENIQEEDLFITTRANTDIALHYYLANITVSLGPDHLHNS